MSGLIREQLLSAASALLAFLSLAPVGYGQINVDKLPKPTGYVSDLAHVLQPAQEAQLEAYCTKVEQQLGVQFAFVTVDSLAGEPIRDVALDISRKWGVGSSKDNSGVVLLLAVKDHLNDIETGRGIEPYITDGFAGSTLARYASPIANRRLWGSVDDRCARNGRTDRSRQRDSLFRRPTAPSRSAEQL